MLFATDLTKAIETAFARNVLVDSSTDYSGGRENKKQNHTVRFMRRIIVMVVADGNVFVIVSCDKQCNTYS